MTPEHALLYQNEGFLHLRDLIPPNLLRELRDAFERGFTSHQDDWRREVAQSQAHPAYCDIPNILDRGDSFVELVDLPALVPFLLGTVGSDVQLNHTHARVFFPGKTFTAPWHSDLKNVLGIDLPHSPNFFVKVHFYLEDLHPDQGCLAFLPGSHRLPADMPRPKIEDIDRSPAVRKIIPRAGDAVLFNCHVLHMALDNRTPQPRRSLIYAYSHFWLKNYANAVPRDLQRYAQTPLRRQLFGLEEEGVAYFDQRHDQSVREEVWNDSFAAASKRLFRRMRKLTSITLPP
ncbi:Hypothetical protein A7982_06605 [Minicystis rosea]|nr:Hypothetical protein A7982_06605 [Minicystis rosea]